MGGLEHVQLQATHQPCWTLRIHQCRDCLPRWLPVRLRWQGRCCHAVGLERGQEAYSLPCEQGDIIHALCFSPNRYWLCAGTDNGIRIWDLEGKGIVDELKLDLPVREVGEKSK